MIKNQFFLETECRKKQSVTVKVQFFLETECRKKQSVTVKVPQVATPTIFLENDLEFDQIEFPWKQIPHSFSTIESRIATSR